MSRIRKDSAVRKAEGDRGNRARKGAAGVPEYDRREIEIPGAPKPPRWLEGEALKLFYAEIEILSKCPGLLSVADSSVLADFCQVEVQKRRLEECQDAAIELTRSKTRGGERAKAGAEGLIRLQFASKLNQMRQRADVLRQKLGKSPLARTQIKLPPIVASRPIQSVEEANEAALDAALSGPAGNLMKV